MRTIVHIGFPKTGTSFLQEELFPKIENVCFARGFNGFRKMYFRDNAFDTLILSDEALIGDFLHTYSMKDVKADFEVKMSVVKEVFKSVEILMAVRKQSDFIYSLYKQHLNQGGICPSFEVFFNLENTGIMKTDDFLFHKWITEVQTKFDNAIIYNYGEMKRLGTEKFTEALLYKLKLDMPRNVDFDKKSNVGIKTKFQFRLLNTLNKVNKIFGGRLNKSTATRLHLSPRKFTHTFGKFIPSKEMKLGPELRSRIDSFYQEDWDKVLMAVEPLK